MAKKFRADVKVLPWMWSCWGISNRNKIKNEECGNAANCVAFKVMYVCHSKIKCKSSKKVKFATLWKIATFLVKKVKFWLKNKTKSDSRILCWVINLIILNNLQASFIHKLNYLLSYHILKSADQFCKFENYFKKYFKVILTLIWYLKQSYECKKPIFN